MADPHSSEGNAQAWTYEKKNYWIFQADPWRERSKSAPMNQDASALLLVSHHAKQIQPDDVVFFWQSGTNAGISGWGRVTLPSVMVRDEVPERISSNVKGNK